jgi:hypothetical protein
MMIVFLIVFRDSPRAWNVLFIVDLVKSRSWLEVENLFLRYQLNIAFEASAVAPSAAWLRPGAADVQRIRAKGIRDRPIAPRSPWHAVEAFNLSFALRR